MKNIFFAFNNQIKQQISGTAIDNTCAPTYAYIFMDKVETEFLETQSDKLFCCVGYIDDVFFIWTHGQEKLKVFWEDLNKFHPNLKFTRGSSKIERDFHDKSTDKYQYPQYTSSHSEHTKRSVV